MSFQQGLSGLNSSAKQLDVIGNNVANSGTVGFKQSQAQFSDMYAASLSGGGAVQIGTGGKVAAVMQQFTQGNVTNTANPMDIAISGQGFFRMVDSGGSVLYSRNGQFQVDKNGYIVNNQGHTLSGYLPDATGAIIPGQPLPIQINSADLPPRQTANVVVGANLDARSPSPTTLAFNTIDPSSYNSSTSMTVYDSLGASHVGSLYFKRIPMAVASLGNGSFAGAGSTMTLSGSTAGLSAGNTVTLPSGTYTITSVDSATQLTVAPAVAGAIAAAAFTATNAPSANWDAYIAIDGTLVPAAATPLARLSFDTLGQLASTTPASIPLGTMTSAVFTPTGAAAQTLLIDFATTSQYGGIFGVNSLTQDGYSSGRLSGFNTSPDGTILGRYTNGQSRALGQVLLSNFTNPQGLQPMGNNEWVESAASGNPLIGTPGSSALGVLQSSAVEDSNVDLTAELVNMITAQRVYQANAQTIKAQDQVLQTLVNLR